MMRIIQPCPQVRQVPMDAVVVDGEYLLDGRIRARCIRRTAGGGAVLLTVHGVVETITTRTRAHWIGELSAEYVAWAEAEVLTRATVRRLDLLERAMAPFGHRVAMSPEGLAILVDALDRIDALEAAARLGCER